MADRGAVREQVARSSKQAPPRPFMFSWARGAAEAGSRWAVAPAEASRERIRSRSACAYLPGAAARASSTRNQCDCTMPKERECAMAGPKMREHAVAGEALRRCGAAPIHIQHVHLEGAVIVGHDLRGAFKWLAHPRWKLQSRDKTCASSPNDALRPRAPGASGVWRNQRRSATNGRVDL